jgi:hypothetical protein
MTDQSPTNRIDAAIKRIEAAVARRDRATLALTKRHETLRARVEEAITALDALEMHNG